MSTFTVAAVLFALCLAVFALCLAIFAVQICRVAPRFGFVEAARGFPLALVSLLARLGS